MVTADEARRELARRELARRRDPRNNTAGKVDAVVRGAADSLGLGFADEIAAGLGTGFGFLGDYDTELERQRAIDRSDEQDRGWWRLGGQVAGGLVGGVGLAKQGLSFAGNALTRGQGLGRVAAGSAADSALLAGAHGFGSGDGLEDRLAQGAFGVGTGAGIGLAAPFAVSGASNAVRRAVTPFSTSPERVAAAQALRQEGIPVTAGQLTGNRRLRFAESEIGGRRAADIMAQQQDGFTSAVLRRAGIDANRATPEVLDDAFRSIGRRFDDLAAANQIIPDQQATAQLRAVFDDYGLNTSESMRAPIVEKVANDIRAALQKGPVSGRAYKELASDIAERARGASNLDTRNALYDLREVLDDAMERSMAAAGSPDVGAWKEARRLYRNLLTVSDTAARAGEQAAEGIVTPAAIRNAAVNQGRRAYARGQGDFADIARAGSMLLSPLPDSGTAGRLSARNLLPNTATVGAILGGAPGSAMGDPTMAVAGALAGAAAPRVAGSVLMSRPAQNALANQLLPGGMSAGNRAISSSVLNALAATAPGDDLRSEIARLLFAR